MRILVVGDSYCPSAALAPAFAPLEGTHQVTFADIRDVPTWRPRSASEGSIHEYLGEPGQVIELLDDHEVLVVQGAPITDAVLDAAPGLRMVGVVRGGPVNVDLAAATARGVPVATAPGKNAVAVAELTIAFAIMLLRRVPEAMRHVDDGKPFGADNFEGAQWFGRDLSGRTIGLVGAGQVGRQVATRAIALGMHVLVHDPFVDAGSIVNMGASPVDLDSLLANADLVSLHARATPDTTGMMDARAFSRMRPGAMFINTARDTMVDETALDAALRSGRLGGAALDVASPPPPSGRHPLLAHPNVLIVAHIGGATLEALARGGELIAAEVGRLARGESIVSIANPEVLRPASSVS